MNEKDVNKLLEISKSLDSDETTRIVESCKIDNPAKAIEESLTSFIMSQFQKIENDNEFQNLIRLHLRQRLGEATFEQLMDLDDRIAKNNTFATTSILSMFKNDQSGKIITDHLKEETNLNSTAKELYDSANDKDMLQAVSYLNQVISKIQSVEAEVKKSS